MFKQLAGACGALLIIFIATIMLVISDHKVTKRVDAKSLRQGGLAYTLHGANSIFDGIGTDTLIVNGTNTYTSRPINIENEQYTSFQYELRTGTSTPHVSLEAKLSVDGESYESVNRTIIHDYTSGGIINVVDWPHPLAMKMKVIVQGEDNNAEDTGIKVSKGGL